MTVTQTTGRHIDTGDESAATKTTPAQADASASTVKPLRARHMLRVDGLSKTFGTVRAVTDVSFTARPGRVTGFLGPNGSGKTTTLRMIVGLVTPTSGTARIGRTPYRKLRHPTRHVGAMLDATCFHPGRTGRDHLRIIATYEAVTTKRVDEVLAIVGLTAAGRRPVGGYSLGMRQRLALAAALVTDPPVLILDEPSNGLDPQGIVWLRELLRELASQGHTVLVSSHALAEVEQTVDDVVIISGGRIVRTSTLDELRHAAEPSVIVETPQADDLLALAYRLHWRIQNGPRLIVLGKDHHSVGDAMFAAGIAVHALIPTTPSLEDTFFGLVSHQPSASHNTTETEQ